MWYRGVNLGRKSWRGYRPDRVTQTLNSPHPSDSQIPDPELNKTPTREEVKEMLKHLPSDKAAGPDGITNRILQASGDQAIDMIYLFMFIIWEVETCPGVLTLFILKAPNYMLARTLTERAV